MHGGDAARADQPADEIADAALGLEIDRRRRAFVASGGKLLIERLAEDGPRAPMRISASPSCFKRERRHLGDVGISPMPPMAGVGGMAMPLVSL